MPASETALRAQSTESPDDVRHNLGFCLKPPEVEQLAIGSISDSDSDVTISKSNNQHGGEHETEQRWCQDTALRHAVGDRKGFGRLTVVLDSCLHAVMKLLHHGDKLPWAAVIWHDLPQTFSTDSVEGLAQVDVDRVNVLFLAFLLQLPGRKHHVDCPALFPESTLAFWSLVKVCCETI